MCRAQTDVWPRVCSLHRGCRSHMASLPRTPKCARGSTVVTCGGPDGADLQGSSPVAVHKGGRAHLECLCLVGASQVSEMPLFPRTLPPYIPFMHVPALCPCRSCPCFHSCSPLSHLTLTLGPGQALLAPGSAPTLSGLPWSARALVIQREGGWAALSPGSQGQRGFFPGRGHSVGKSGSHLGSQSIHL